MTYKERRARRIFEIKRVEIRKLEDQIQELKEDKSLAEDYLITINGPCVYCQNAHWPHCNAH